MGRVKKLFVYKGETKPLEEWAALFGIKKDTLWSRLKSGWSLIDTLETPIGGSRVDLLGEEEEEEDDIDDNQGEYLRRLRFRCYRALRKDFEEKIPYYFSLPDPSTTENTFTWKIRNPSMRVA